MRIVSVPAALLLLAVATAGCADAAGAGAGKMVSELGFAKLDKATGTEYLGIRAKKKVESAYLVINVPRDLWPPFRYEVTAGLFDPSRAWTGGGFFCTEVSRIDSNPLDFYDICGQPVASGINVFTADMNGSRKTRLFTGATRVDLAVEHDGTDLVLYARATGEPDWIEIDRFNRPAGPDPYLGGIGAAQIAFGQEAGFDEFRVVENGSPPSTPSAPDGARESVFQALDPLVEALHALNDTAPDSVQASMDLERAESALADARTDVDALLVLGKKKLKNPSKTASKKLAKAGKSLAAAAKKLEANKKARGIVKVLKKAAKAELQAADALHQIE
jgi:hypothetical protein